MHSYSQDLRDRVLWALERGERPSAIARRLEVGRIWVYRVRDRKQKTGSRTSLQIGGHRRSRIAGWEAQLRAWLKAEPDLSLQQMCDRLAQEEVAVKPGALWHQLDKWGLTFKKTLHASEQERQDVVAARQAWLEALPKMNAEKLVFIDETWTSTNMTRRYGRAPRGQRCRGSAPCSHWQTTTFVGALRRSGISATMVLDEPMDGDVFLAYVEQVLVPTLTPGEIVILDNLGSHKVPGVREAILGAEASVLYLPPYSPDLNPIENFFAKLKALLRKAAKRSTETLWEEIAQLLHSVSSQECLHYFAACGYVYT